MGNDPIFYITIALPFLFWANNRLDRYYNDLYKKQRPDEPVIYHRKSIYILIASTIAYAILTLTGLFNPIPTQEDILFASQNKDLAIDVTIDAKTAALVWTIFGSLTYVLLKTISRASYIPVIYFTKKIFNKYPPLLKRKFSLKNFLLGKAQKKN